jgi:hypothetical protein
MRCEKKLPDGLCEADVAYEDGLSAWRIVWGGCPLRIHDEAAA